MRRFRPALMPLLVATLACSSASADETSSSAESSADEDSSASTTESGEETGEETGTTDVNPAIATISGRTLDQNGEPLALANGQLCGPVNDEGDVVLCYFIDPNKGEMFEDGTWTKDVLASAGPGNYNLKWIPAADGDRFFSGSAELITVNEGDDLQITPDYTVVDIPNVTEFAQGETKEVDMGGGLVLTVVGDTMDWGFSDPKVGGVPMPQEFWRFDEHQGEPVIAIWAMGSFWAHSKDEEAGMEFVINDAMGQEPGASVNIYEMEKDNSFIHEVGVGTVSADGTMITSDAAIRHLSWLIVTTP